MILEDWQGALKLHAVPQQQQWSRSNDKDDDTAGNLVLTLDRNGSSNNNSVYFGAEARKHLPFRSYAETTSAMPRNTIPRPTYLGLGSGSQGGDGGSFWFFEDVSEDGAADRWRWEKDGVGSRAIWTVWLFGAPSPVIGSLRKLLEGYPALPPPLPPWVSHRPWHDGFVAVSVSATPEQDGEQLQTGASNAAAPGRRPLPMPPVSPSPLLPPAVQALREAAPKAAPPPTLASQPMLRGLSQSTGDSHPFTPVAASPLMASTTCNTPPLFVDGPHDLPRRKRPTVDRNDDRLEKVDQINASVGSAPRLSAIVPGQQSGSVSKEEDTASADDTAVLQQASHLPSFRDSLVAVDTETGAIVGVIAHNVHLSDGGDGGDDVSHTRDTSKASVTPRPSVLRPATTHIDEDARRDSSRRGSVLGIDTFAPPPVPDKDAARDSLAISASDADNFLSAKEDQTSGDDDTDVENEHHDHLVTALRLGVLETHRPDLLRDAADDEDDDGAASDASGSTVGGPAMKLWRKARGGKEGEKKRAAKKAAKALLSHQDRKRRGGDELHTSESSVRTSRAETAREGDDEGGSDGSDGTEDGDDERASVQVPAPAIAPSPRPISSASLSTLPPEEASSSPESAQDRLLRLHGHPTRADMNTSQMVATEDAIWREAFDGGHLPLDGAYTHLAARRGQQQEEGADKEEDEHEEEQDLSLDPASRDAPELGQVQASSPLYLQGGTVLIEFLSGSSRITASIIKRGVVGDDDESAARQHEANEAAVAAPASGIASLIPALPSHILNFFLGGGGSSGGKESTSNAANDDAAQQQPSSLLASWATATSSAVTSPLFSLFGWWSGSGINADSKTVDTISTPASDDEWEAAIPAFDPNSLASTPRPIYRRKRPSPSAENGFRVREDKARKDDVNRYSIIHFDGQGVGRRAFVGGDGGCVGVGEGGGFMTPFGAGLF